MDDLQLDYIAGQLFDAEDLYYVGAYEDAIEICDDILEEWGVPDDEDVMQTIALVMLCRGKSLGGLERFDEELLAYEEIATRFDGDESPDLLPPIAEAQFNAAVVTGQMGLAEKSIEMYASFIRCYQGSTEPEIQEQVIRARFNRAITLRHTGRAEEALSHLNELVARYGAASEEPEYYETVAGALASKAALELCMGQHAAAIESAILGVEKCGAYLPLERFHCHLVLASAYLISRDIVSGEERIASMLDLLPKVDGLPTAMSFSSTLRDMAMVVGRDRILELIQRSPSAEILSSLVETLKWEIQRESGKLKGIEEAAKEFQGDFAWLDRIGV